MNRPPDATRPPIAIRLLYLSGYSQSWHHRKVELLADAPDIRILNVNGPGCDRAPGRYLSANGQSTYDLRVLHDVHIGAYDIYRTFHWPPRFELRTFRPHLIYCEHEQEGLLALEATLMRDLFARRTPLILYTWQNILRRRRWYVRAVSQMTLRGAQHVFCANAEGAEVLRRQGYRGGASIVQQMGVDTRLFYPRPQADDAERPFTIGYVGRLVPEKGVDVLLQAISTLQGAGKERTTQPMRLVVVGSGLEKGRLQALAAQLGIADYCRWVEAVSHEKLVDSMNALDLLVLPSRTTSNWKEQFGRVLVEAMACRVAVAGSDSGAIPEVIGDVGRIFPEGDASALAAIFTQLADAPGLRRTLAEAGYHRALANYTTERLAEETLAVFRALAHTPESEQPYGI